MSAPRIAALLRGWMLVVIVVLAVNLVVATSFTVPRWRAQRGVAGAAGGIESARQRLEPRLQRARETHGRVVTAERDLETFYDDLVVDVSGAELMAMLVGAASDAGILLDDASFQFAPVPELGLVQLVISAPLTGDYQSVRRLLDGLVELPVFLIVEGIGLSAMPGGVPGGGGDRLRIELTLSVFMEDLEIPADGLASFGGRGVAAPVTLRQIEDAAQRVPENADPEDLAEVLVERLAALPPLPVDPSALIVHLDRLEQPASSRAPTRNLFATVEPPPPPPVARPPVVVPDPEPVIPVELLGVMRVAGVWHASLIDDDGELFVAAAGDSLSIGVQIVEVGADYAEIAFGDEVARLILEGQFP